MNELDPHFSDKFLHRIFWGLGIFLIIAIIGITFRIVEYIKLRSDTNQQTIPTVATITVSNEPPHEQLILPGNVLAWHQATIFARTNGYLITWYTDIGSQVKAGDVLAEISTPEVDQQLRQTEGQLKTAVANYQLAQITSKRWQNLWKTRSVSRQTTDEAISNEKAQAAIVTSTTALRDRLHTLVNFEKVIAPFDGIIMSRTTDIGQLINAGNSGTMPLFRMVQSNPLRVYVRVPQIYSSRIRPGLIGELHFLQHPGKVYHGKLLNTARAIDYRSRTLLIQLEVDNSDYELFPGSYSEVHLIIPPQKNAVIIPVNTLLFQAQGLQVAVLTKDNKTILKSITVGRDFGSTVEVIAGLKPGDKIILNPPDSLVSGQTVRPTSQEENKQQQGGDKTG